MLFDRGNRRGCEQLFAFLSPLSQSLSLALSLSEGDAKKWRRNGLLSSSICHQHLVTTFWIASIVYIQFAIVTPSLALTLFCHHCLFPPSTPFLLNRHCSFVTLFFRFDSGNWTHRFPSIRFDLIRCPIVVVRSSWDVESRARVSSLVICQHPSNKTTNWLFYSILLTIAKFARKKPSNLSQGFCFYPSFYEKVIKDGRFLIKKSYFLSIIKKLLCYKIQFCKI